LAAGDGSIITSEAAEVNDLRQQIVGILFLCAYIISGITFIRWMRRAYYNYQLKIDYALYKDAAVAYSWFVPILCLYRPYQIMKELFSETKRLLAGPSEEKSGNFSSSYIGGWWALWIISSIAGQISFRIMLNAETVSELTDSTLASIISAFIDLPLGIITLAVIKDYSKMEPALALLENEVKEIQPILPDATTPGIEIPAED
jgi:hypothetical protein